MSPVDEAEPPGTSARDATRPLEGLLVVAIEQAVAAPLCTARLADAGARVIKVERAGGDFARGYDAAARGDSSYFAWLNHAKESVELDFKRGADAALLERLVGRADVFVQNLSPGALGRAGFGSEALRARHPGLVTCDISGYGEGEAVRALKAYDLLVQAESGLVSISGGPGAPGRIGVSLCDIGAGVTAHAAVLEALIGRAATGRGRGVAVSLFDVAAEWMTVPLVHAETGAGAPRRIGIAHPSIAPYGAFPSEDGTLTVISIQNEREWVRLCETVLGVPALARDPRFASNVGRVAHRAALDEAISAITSRSSAAALREALGAASIAYGALNGVDELGRHAALRRREVVNSAGRGLSLPAHPVRTAGGAPAPAPTVPRVGEHTEAIRREFG